MTLNPARRGRNPGPPLELHGLRVRGVETVSGLGPINTMHLANGLEFRAVVVMPWDDDVMPSQEMTEAVTDAGVREEVYNTERRLLRRLHAGAGRAASDQRGHGFGVPGCSGRLVSHSALVPQILSKG
jgi:hypothetical protein